MSSFFYLKDTEYYYTGNSTGDSGGFTTRLSLAPKKSHKRIYRFTPLTVTCKNSLVVINDEEYVFKTLPVKEISETVATPDVCKVPLLCIEPCTKTAGPLLAENIPAGPFEELADRAPDITNGPKKGDSGDAIGS